MTANAIVVSHRHKTYGEIFGLLRMNGVGKTSTSAPHLLVLSGAFAIRFFRWE